MSRSVRVRLASGRPSSSCSLYREIGDLTLRVLTRVRRGESRPAQDPAPDDADRDGIVGDDAGDLNDLVAGGLEGDGDPRSGRGRCRGAIRRRRA